MSARVLCLAGAALLVVLAAVFGRSPHPHVWWETIPAYSTVFGYGGAWLLIWLAKSLLAPLLRDEAAEGGDR